MIHSSHFQPRIWAYEGTAVGTQIDRLQDMTVGITLNRTKMKEIGRKELIDWRDAIPAITLSLRQYEYGEMEFWRQLANTTLVDTTVTEDDFETTQVDIAAYETSADDTFLSTVWYPNLRVAGFGVNIGDPDAIVERSINLVGEDENTLQGNNKYLIFLLDTTCVGASHTIIIGSGAWSTYPDPVVDPDHSGDDTYILKLVKVTAAGVASELEITTDYTYNLGTKTITIPGSAASDTFKVYYSATTYISGAVPFTDNDLDAAGLLASYCSIYLETSTYVYKLQSVAVDVTFDRTDYKEIGNEEVVVRGVRDTTVRVTLGRFLEEWTVEEILRGVVADYGKIDVREFLDNLSLTIKIYNNANKDTFLIGYKFTNLSPTGMDQGVAVDDYANQGITLEADNFLITSDENEL